MKPTLRQRIRAFWNPADQPKPTPDRLKTQIISYPRMMRAVDISDWKTAIDSWRNDMMPQTYRLQELYTDLFLDGHLSAVVNKRVNAILNLDLCFRDEAGESIPAVEKFVNHPDFAVRFQRDVMHSLFFGYTCIQLNYKSERFSYDLIPRENIIPQRAIFVPNKTGISGEPLDNYKGVLLIWDGSMGIFATTAQYCIMKRNGMADYAQYAELFSMPIADIKYQGNDPKVKKEIQEAMQNQGANANNIWPADVEISSRNLASTASNDIYTGLIDVCNKEISKVILGQTMTTEDGGSRSQAEVHKDVEDSIFASDKQFMLHFLNYTMKPYLMAYGVPCDLGEFQYDETEKEDITTLIDSDLKLKELMPIDPDYWYEKYGVPKPKQTPQTTDGKDTNQ